MKRKVRRLAAEDDRSAFRSGNIELDRFFLLYAGQHQFRHHLGTTYVAVDASASIAGYATVTASEITSAELPSSTKKRLPRYPLPVLRLARLAVDERSKGTGVGRLLLQCVFALADQVATDIGCVGVVVDTKPEAVAFYEKLGFEPLETVSGELGERPAPTPMFLPAALLRARDLR